MDRLFRTVSKDFEAEIRLDRVVIHREFSDTAAEIFPNHSLDWIYIDGNHLYEFVLRDLESYYPKVKRGGFLSGDDYGVMGWWANGVEKAVATFVSAYPEVRLFRMGNQFILKRGL
jgi:hypothetical protein